MNSPSMMRIRKPNVYLWWYRSSNLLQDLPHSPRPSNSCALAPTLEGSIVNLSSLFSLWSLDKAMWLAGNLSKSGSALVPRETRNRKKRDMTLKRLLLLIGKNLLYFTDLKIPAILLTYQKLLWKKFVKLCLHSNYSAISLSNWRFFYG